MSGVDYVFKLLTLGESTVGKSSIILRYTNGQFNQNLLSTTGIDFKTKIIEHKNEKIKLVIYDTSGQERYRTIAANYYKNADGILFVYDITQKNTLTFNYWLEQIKEKSSVKAIILFGNKTDLDSPDNKNEDVPKREITKEEGEKVAEQYGLKLFEGSAKDDINIDAAILELVDLIYKEQNIQSGDKKQPEMQKVQKLSTKTVRIKQKGACCSNPV